MSGQHPVPIVQARYLERLFMVGTERVYAVRDVDLSIYANEFVGIVGPSGCGKSTLLNIIGLVEAPSAGELLFEGVSLHGASEAYLENLRREKVGYVFQAFNLLSTLTVEENVMLPCMLGGQDSTMARERANELLRDLGLIHRSRAMPATLSGGEMQRVAVARAIAHRPALIVADEPTGNLDSASGESVLALLQEIHNAGTAVVMATHSDVAMQRCTRVVSMRDGATVNV